MKSNSQLLKSYPIGGNHAIQDAQIFYGFNQKYKVFFTNARSAIYSIIKNRMPTTIWIPSYVCESLLHPEYPIKFFRVKEDLTIDKSFLKKIKKPIN